MSGTTKSSLRWLVALSLIGCSGAGPTTLATGQREPWGIAVQGAFVYWVNRGGTVMRVPTGGGTPTVLAAGQANPSSIAVDANRVYWTNAGAQTCMSQTGACGANPDGSVMSMPLAGGTPTLLAGGLCGPDSIAVDAVNVYVTDAGNGRIAKLPIAGGTPTTLASGQFLVGSLAVDATSVYWTAFDLSGLQGSVMQVPITGGVPTAIASGWAPVLYGTPCGTTATTLAAEGASVYWSAGSMATGVNPVPPSLMKIAVDGGTPIAIAAMAELGEEGVGTIAVDTTSAYWTNGEFFKVPIGGGAATTIAMFDEGIEAQTGSYAMDGQNLYWADGTGRILSTPKSP